MTVTEQSANFMRISLGPKNNITPLGPCVIDTRAGSDLIIKKVLPATELPQPPWRLDSGAANNVKIYHEAT